MFYYYYYFYLINKIFLLYLLKYNKYKYFNVTNVTVFLVLAFVPAVPDVAVLSIVVPALAFAVPGDGQLVALFDSAAVEDVAGRDLFDFDLFGPGRHVPVEIVGQHLP